MTYSEAAKAVRVPLGFVLAAFYLAFARPTVLTLSVGGAIALGGLCVRAWASGHIRKNAELATTGPYAHTRNPLYFGSFLIAAGFAIAAHWTLLLPVAAFFVLVYAPTIERERRNIRERFPDEYARYERHVPAFLPRARAWREAGDAAAGGFDFSLYMRHGEWKAALGFVAAVAWLVYRMRPRP